MTRTRTLYPSSIALLSLSKKSLLFLLLILLSSGTMAQNLDGTTPTGAAPGAPAGSYPLSDFDTINLFNGNLNFSLPLVKVSGRGGAGHVVPLKIENKWSTVKYGDYEIYYANDQGWGFPVGYSKGRLEGRVANFPDLGCEIGVGGIYYTLLRLTFTAPDGTEYELRDKATNGALGYTEYNEWCGLNNTTNRGKVFVTSDGSSATFVSDTDLSDGGADGLAPPESLSPSGYLMLRDGARYRVDSGQISWMRDSEGNLLNFSYSSGLVTQITDSLGRSVTFTYRDYYMTIPDQITYQGFGGASRIVRVYYSSLSQVLRAGYSTQTIYQLFPELSGVDHTSYNPPVPSSLQLPDGREYRFKYNSYGELARVELPTGGAFEYDWEGGVPNGNTSGVMSGRDIYRRVIKRRVYADGGSGSAFTSEMTIGKAQIASGDVYSIAVENWNSAGARLSKSVHSFFGTAHGYGSYDRDPTHFAAWQVGKELKTETFDTNGTTVLRRVEHLWQQPTATTGWPLTQPESVWSAKLNNPQITQTTNTVVDTNQVSKQTFSYDNYGNQTDAWEYGFGNGAAPAYATRHSQRTFITTNPANGLDYASPNPTASSIHIRNLPASDKVYSVNPSNGAETLIAQSQTSFDEPAYPILSYGSVVGWIDPGAARGNPTTTKNWLNTTGAWIEKHAQYDQVGNLRKNWDAKGYLSQIEYSAGYHYAYPTLTISPVPDPTGQTGSSTPLTASMAYDFYTGLITSATDQNNQVTSFAYSDLLDRLTTVTRPSGGGSTNYSYSDSVGNLYVREQTSLDASRLIESYKYFDRLGRPHRSYLNEGGGTYLVTDTEYDSMGRVWHGSNPYRSTILNGTINPSGIWTTTLYDSLGRVTSMTTADSAAVTTSYIGDSVTVTDQTVKKRKSVTDALGRLKEVYEDPTSLNYLTSYTYDALDNLTTVTQGSQTRTYVYDSLQRLTSATNPESGTVTYQYDNNGNLTQKTDARAVSITYAYDALNRNITVDYSDTTGINPDLSRFYDGATIGKGRFWYNYAGGNFSTGSNVEHTAIDSYDALGRPTVQRQLSKLNGTWGPTYQIQRGYNLAGGITTQTYPSGRTVSYAYDNAGRASSFSGNLGDGVSRTYATGIIYSPLGGVAKEQFGTDTPVYNKSFYNSRGQLAEIRVSTSYTGPTDTTWNRGAIINHYSDQCWGMCGGESSAQSMTDNNGNLRKQEVYIPHNDQASSYTTWWQRYDYDNLNRLQRVAEITGNPQTDWQQEYKVYDRWGNRTIHQTNTWGAGINKKDFTVNTANNRLGVPGGQSGTMTYDNAGNLTNDTYTGAGSRAYDAENRMTQAWGGSNQWQVYTYNADGQRVRRKVNGVETWQIYGMDGELLAEYAANGATATPKKEYGYRNGQLFITAEAPAGQSPLTVQNVTWTNVSPTIQVNGNSIQKVSGTSSWYDAGAVSSQAIATGDGYVEFTPGEINTWRMCGLGNADGDAHYADIDYAFFLVGGGWLQIYESGNFRGDFGAYAATDRMKVAVEGGVVKYYRNSTLLYTSTVAPTYPLKVDASLNTVWSVLNNVVIASDLQNVTWTNVSPTIQVNGNSIQKVSGTSSWYDAGAVSSQAIATGDGYVEFTPGEINTWRMCGLGNADGDAHYADIDYAFFLVGGGWLQIYESGNFRGDFGAYAATDRMKVAVEGGVVKYYRNSTLLYTSTVAPTYPLKVDASLNTVWSPVYNVVIAGSSSGTASGGIQWLVADHLGTPRMIFDKTGSLAATKRHDYLPFGEELFALQGLRTTGRGYSGDNIRQKFTSYERDNETDLDYAQARYYASVHGRFTSVDPLMASAITGNPQTFNRYTYALNSPQTHTDPTGMLPVDQAPGGWGPGKESTLKAGLGGALTSGGIELTPILPRPYLALSFTIGPDGSAVPSPWVSWIHNSIIANATPGLTRSQRQQIAQAGADMDQDLSAEGAYKHAMRAPDELDLVAAFKATVFTYYNMREARALQREYIKNGGSGFSDKALYEIGKAVHTLTDATSPEHTGFQVWHGWGSRLNKIRGVAHGLGEYRINPAQMRDAVNMARVPFRFVFGEKLARQAFHRPKR